MAQPAPELAHVTRVYDAKTRVVLERTAKQIRARITRMGSSFSADIRKAQLSLVLRQIDAMLAGMWTGPMLDIAHDGGKAGAKAAEDATATLTRPMYAGLPPDVADALSDGLTLTANNQIERAFARVPRRLSDAVYRNAGKDQAKVHELIESGLASGLNAREMAKEVYQYVSPTTPGGASYAAMRLARTEINNAFHEQQRVGATRPGVKNAVWNLSGSHKVPDECNIYAVVRTYPADSIPDKPHPQCFCYITYDTMSPDEFEAALAAGDFDNEIDRRTKANMARLGQPTEEPTPERPALRVVRDDEPKTGNAAQAIVPKGLFKDGTLNANQTKALKTYETGAFRAINELARSRRDPADRDDERTMATILELDGAMAESKIPEDIQVWRGMYQSRRLFGDRLDNDLTGFAWDDYGFGSTTTEESVADIFAPRSLRDTVKMRVLIPKGTGALQTSTDELGSPTNGPQAELTLQRGLTWKVARDNGYDEKGIRQLDVEVTRIDDRAGTGEGASGGGRNAGTERAGTSPSGRTVPTNEAIEDSVRSGIESSEKLAGGVSAETTKVKFKDGTAGVRKFIDNNTAKHQQDAEELVALLARMMGIPAPEVVRVDERTTVQQFLSGEVAAGALPFILNPGTPDAKVLSASARVKSYVDSNTGWLMAVMDQITGNQDRHDGNWLVRDGEISGVIDHGLAYMLRDWRTKRHDRIGLDDAYIFRTKSEFTKKFAKANGTQVDIDLHPDDLDAIQEIMGALRDDYASRGRLDWWQFSMKQIDALRPYAKGKKRRIQ